MTSHAAALSSCAGLVIAPLLWAINMQLGQMLPYSDCVRQSHYAALGSFLAGLFAAASGILSWRYGRSGGLAETSKSSALRFFGYVSGLAGFIFAFALLMQGAAAVVLTGCER